MPRPKEGVERGKGKKSDGGEGGGGDKTSTGGRRKDSNKKSWGKPVGEKGKNRNVVN